MAPEPTCVRDRYDLTGAMVVQIDIELTCLSSGAEAVHVQVPDDFVAGLGRRWRHGDHK